MVQPFERRLVSSPVYTFFIPACIQVRKNKAFGEWEKKYNSAAARQGPYAGHATVLTFINKTNSNNLLCVLYTNNATVKKKK